MRDEFITAVRKWRGLKTLAEACGVRQATVGQWTEVPICHVLTAAKTFDVTPKEVRPDLVKLFYPTEADGRRVTQVEPGSRLRYVYYFGLMRVGDEWIIVGDENQRKSARVAAHWFSKSHPEWGYRTKTISREGSPAIRIWRIS